jgi:hypothetical protein
MQEDDAPGQEDVEPTESSGVHHHTRAMAMHLVGSVVAGLLGVSVCALLVVGAASMLGRQDAERGPVHQQGARQ